MVKRRSLDDALTPEEQAFLDEGKSKPAKPKTTPKPNAKKEAKPMARPAIKKEPVYAPPTNLMPVMPATMAIPNLVSLNTRIPPHLSAALLTASMQRKIQRITPNAQQDLVAEALTDWLRKHGFLS